MPGTVPDTLTHYTKSPGTLFRSISALPIEEAEALVRDSLDEGNTLAHARFGNAEYLRMRLDVEVKMRRLFLEKGGRPVLEHPFYFVLGAAPWFESHEADLWKVEIPLDDIPTEAISFTYPDSMISFALAEGTWFRNEVCGKPCNGRVFRREEVPGLLEAYGYPGDRWRSEPAARYDYYLEAQVWNDEMVAPCRDRADRVLRL